MAAFITLQNNQERHLFVYTMYVYIFMYLNCLCLHLYVFTRHINLIYVLKYNVSDSFATLNGTDIITFDLENVLYLVMGR
jgi:hypothetical protein